MSTPQTAPQSVDVDGHYRALIGKRAIGAVDLEPGDEKIVTITRVTQEDVVDMSIPSRELDARKKRGESIMVKKLAVHINGTDRFIIINGERGDDLGKLFSTRVKTWVGQRVLLYRQEAHMPRLRFKAAPAARAQEATEAGESSALDAPEASAS